MRPLICALFLFAGVSLVAAQESKQDPPKREKALESKDEGMRFGTEAWKRVAPAAEKLYKEKGIDFVVETAVSPKGGADKIAMLKPAEREKFFKDFTDERAKELKLKGVHVFVSKQPPTLYVHVTESADLPKGFGTKLKDTLIASFKNDKFDEGLNKAIDMTLAAKGLGEKK